MSFNQSSRQVVYLDTSIQIERFMGPYQKRIDIEKILKDQCIQFVTSKYVFMEFQRSLLSNYIYVYNQILSHDDWEATAYAIRSGSRGYRPRAMGQCFQILTTVMDACERNQRHALEFLKIHITRDLPKRFWRNVTVSPDIIVCDLVQSDAKSQADGRYKVADSCRKTTATCLLPNFLDQNEAKLHKVSEHLSEHPSIIKNQDKVQQLIAKITENSQDSLGQATCWPLGDLIIALQIPVDADFWTLDSDFKSFADALGFSLYEPA